MTVVATEATHRLPVLDVLLLRDLRKEAFLGRVVRANQVARLGHVLKLPTHQHAAAHTAAVPET